MVKIIISFLLLTLSLGANEDFASIFEVSKGSKQLGSYEISAELSGAEIVTKSNGVANKVKFFIDKKISYKKDGHKQVVFVKNQKAESFEIKTKLSAIDEDTKEEYKRKIKKVKQDSMLLITKTGKNRIELFNKRPTIIKTLDEVIVDISTSKVDYSKFILFDKMGVMKMVARVEKSSDGYIIINKTKKKNYIGIVVENGAVSEVKSLVSNWKMKLVKTGVYKKTTVEITKLLQKSIASSLSSSFTKTDISLSSKLKTTKKSYITKATFALTLPSTQESKKDYEKAKYCKKMLKKSGVKAKKVSIDGLVCKTDTKIKLDRLKQNKKMVASLESKYGELKETKKIKIAKSTISYKIFEER